MVLLLTAAACGGGKPTTGTEGTVQPLANQVLSLEQLYTLEAAGVPPGDTSVTFPAGAARHVILRHGPPDNTVFAELIFPAGVFGGINHPDSVRVSVKPRPGIYGVEFACNVPLGPGARLVFKYPVHFSAPVGAQQKYGTPVAFERALSIARLLPDGRYLLLPSTRPAADNLEALLTESGTFLVAAPR